METLLGLIIGLGLSAACGFRVFVPLLIIGISSHAGHLSLSPGFAWIGSWPAILAFSVASIIEIGCYYIPWLDSGMDLLMTPAAVIAGIIATASCINDVSPFLKWSCAIIGGGGLAGTIQGTTVALRGASTATSGGLANFLLSTSELVASLAMSILSIVLPVAGIILLGVLCWRIIRKLSEVRLASGCVPSNE